MFAGVWWGALAAIWAVSAVLSFSIGRRAEANLRALLSVHCVLIAALILLRL